LAFAKAQARKMLDAQLEDVQKAAAFRRPRWRQCGGRRSAERALPTSDEILVPAATS
jgi:hypothetical protein